MTNEATTLILTYEGTELLSATVVTGGQPVDGLTGMDSAELALWLAANKPTYVTIVDENGEHQSDN